MRHLLEAEGIQEGAGKKRRRRQTLKRSGSFAVFMPSTATTVAAATAFADMPEILHFQFLLNFDCPFIERAMKSICGTHRHLQMILQILESGIVFEISCRMKPKIDGSSNTTIHVCNCGRLFPGGKHKCNINAAAASLPKLKILNRIWLLT